MSGRSFDIIVIGAGIAGASIAALLAQSRRVLVLERESQPGYHSTGRSAALYSRIYGPDAVRALTRASGAFLHAAPPGFSEAPLLRRRGSMFVAGSDQITALETFADLPDVKLATRRLSAREAREICPILRPGAVAAALLEPESADVDVHALHQGCLRQLRGAGGQVLTDCAVDAIERSAAGWSISSRADTFTAPVIVNAAGAWADEFAHLARVRPAGLQPKRRTALLVDAPADVPIGSWPLVIDIDERFYFKPDAGLLLLSPADQTPTAPCDAQPDDLDCAIAIDRVQSIADLPVRRIRHKWAGLRTFAPDGIPIVGYDPEAAGFFWLAGQGGYGIQSAPALAAFAAALVLGRPVPAAIAAEGVHPDDLSPARLRSRSKM
jgi:D-arginine dehydrogenase